MRKVNKKQHEDSNNIRIVRTPIWLLILAIILIAIGIVVWFSNGFIDGAMI